MNGPPNSTVPDVLLERYRLGELPEGDALELRRQIDSDQALQARLAALQQSDAEILAQHPGFEVVRSIQARLAHEVAPARVRRLRAIWLVPATAALVVAAIGLLPLLESTRREQLKGAGPRLLVYRKTAVGSEVLESGAIVRAGDLLRVGYRPAGQRFGVIISVDGRGVVTQHLPASGGQAALLSAKERVLLDSSFELDDAPGWERFYLVTSNAPFAVATVKAAAASLARSPGVVQPPALRLPRGFAQVVFELRKEPQ
jgi:anti-sigma factor RsiW